MLIGMMALASGMAPAMAGAADRIPIEEFVKHAQYSATKISPDGRYLALTVQQDDTMSLAVLRLEDMKFVRVTSLTNNESVGSFYWVGPNRLMYTSQKNFGTYASPFGTGEWYAMDADGSRPRSLVSYSAQSLQGRDKVVHFNEHYEMLDPMPGDEARAIMTITDSAPGGRNQVISIDTVTGRRRVLARAPREDCQLILDAKREPRYANCYFDKAPDGSYDQHSELYRREEDDSWTLVNRSLEKGRQLHVIGTGADGRIYVLADDGKGPAAFGLLDPADDSFHTLYQDPAADPSGFLVASDRHTLLGVVTTAGAPHVEMIDRDHPDAKVYAALSSAFPGRLVDFTSATVDGKKVVVSVRSATDPGQLYLFDRDTGSVRFLMKSRPSLDPALMAEVRPFSFKTRDGVTEYGYLTIPRGGAKGLPTIINPHGGPIGVRDEWGFNPEAQMLANRGYLVVQLNFRGSGGYGQAFEDSGHGEWGEKMQDDLTDVTRWVVEQGYADPNRICIYGGSYGGYASLMGVATQPDLYQCAVGYVGVYDLDMLYKKGDIAARESGQRYLRRTIGTDPAELERRSPVSLAGRITAPVFLAAGLKDVRAPHEHTEEMRDALKGAGHPPEVVILQPDEMHGFYGEEANLNLYTKMLAFFDKYIGGGAKAVGRP
ncbi:MAG TPA: S9 family peptidase [Xanthomonadaceae bacterium]|nr:S9 family peptidase [Xanthomonadaceae bacterium]